MKDIQDNQIEQVEDISTSNIGKFGSVEELFKAYNALEKEFTKRCQLIKQLQAEKENKSAQAQEQIAEATVEGAAPSEELNVSCGEPIAADDRPAPEPAPAAEPPEAQEPPAQEQCEPVDIIAFAVKYVDAIADIPEIVDEVLARYKRKLSCRGGGSAPVGTAVIMPAMRPRTLADAKRLADEILG
ncbi:MAG: hypothetical protein HDT28_05095 [Clostridiales bacterium]|nr:hypothetical protein [Clostridiales bacterium]